MRSAASIGTPPTNDWTTTPRTRSKRGEGYMYQARDPLGDWFPVFSSSPFSLAPSMCPSLLFDLFDIVGILSEQRTEINFAPAEPGS